MRKVGAFAPEIEVFHATAYFSGRVQGVGFRYHTLQIAKEFDVSGFVKNLPDGRVLLEAEGDSAEVRAFTAEVSDRLGVYIRTVESREGVRSAQIRGFTIAH